MELRFTPSFFYGAAAAALMGLSLGVALHGPWQAKDGGPRILLSSAAAAQTAQADDSAYGGYVEASAQTAQTDASLYEGSLPAAPLPVTRLKPDRYPDLWSGRADVSQARADQGERAYSDDLYPDDRSDDDRGFRSESAQDDERPATDQMPRGPMRYSAMQGPDPYYYPSF
jgi:hypothetical protein